ncbi:MAG: flavin-containing monooxygenase [Alphaproteobacteria bacterium]
MTQTSNPIDVLIIGAGISGIAAAYYIQKRCPSKSYTILESRDAMGGTWDLFRYPGIRSDSDLYTFGYSFRPWLDDEAFAGRDKIKSYIEDTAQENGIDQHIRFGHKVIKAAWDSKTATWTVTAKANGETLILTCHVLYMCPGYYDYSAGYLPQWDGTQDFEGDIIHPQSWPEDTDYTGKNITVIGSGATAVTLIPSLAEKAAHVTMLQRSPTYIVEMPARDPLAIASRKHLGAKISHKLIRWKNILRTIFYYQIARRFPSYMKKQVMSGAQTALGPDFDVQKHLNPTYNPWDQRVCIDKNGDMFAAIKAGKASIVTDHIKNFTAYGLALESGSHLDADMVITATGLNMQFLGGVDLTVDGTPIDVSQTYMYKGMMFSGLPNLVYSIGYTNASWTLKCELIARYACRLINEMDKSGKPVMAPVAADDIVPRPALDLESGYIFRAEDKLPKQGEKAPWRVYQNYVLDKISLGMGTLHDKVMHFSSKTP